MEKEIRFVLHVPKGASDSKSSPQYKGGHSNKIRRTLALSKNRMGSFREGVLPWPRQDGLFSDNLGRGI